VLKPNWTVIVLTFIIEVVDQVEDEITRTLSIPLGALGVRLGRELSGSAIVLESSVCLCHCHLR
jgi:hypothetical protein